MSYIFWNECEPKHTEIAIERKNVFYVVFHDECPRNVIDKGYLLVVVASEFSTGFSSHRLCISPFVSGSRSASSSMIRRYF